LTDEQVLAFVDRRFFEGGEHYTDTTDKALGLEKGTAMSGAAAALVVQNEKGN
jgi:hypothetical protein